ncbi:voltage-gated cation channel, partial [Reticulomyxa filosa]
GYIRDNWNKFDFTISVVGVIGLASGSSFRLSVFRLFRIGRLLRLVHQAQTLKILFYTLIESAPSLWNVGLLLVVIFFIYAIIGMNLFGLANIDPSVRRQANFDTFVNSYALLYRVATQDDWDVVYAAYLNAYRGKSRLFTVYLFFISFFIFGTAVLINLFIAVVLESFRENKEAFSRDEKLEPIKVWRNLWVWFEPEAKGKLNVEIFLTLLRLSPNPVGFNDDNPFENLMFATQQLKKLKHKKSIQGKSAKSLPGFENNKAPSPVNSPPPEDDGAGERFGKRRSNSFILSRKLLAMIPMTDRQKRMKELEKKVSHKDMLLRLRRLKLMVHRKKAMTATYLTSAYGM